jgi:hypothetical protein
MSLRVGGKTIMSYVVAGVLLSLIVGTATYAFALIIKMFANSFTLIHDVGMNVTGGTPTHTTIPVGNETIVLPQPSNTGLSAVADLLTKFLVAVGNVLTSPVGIAVLIALTLITLALTEK